VFVKNGLTFLYTAVKGSLGHFHRDDASLRPKWYVFVRLNQRTNKIGWLVQYARTSVTTVRSNLSGHSLFFFFSVCKRATCNARSRRAHGNALRTCPLRATSHAGFRSPQTTAARPVRHKLQQHALIYIIHQEIHKQFN
jgi:hypothetical protein